MTTSEQAALLAKHGIIYAAGASRCAVCYFRGSLAYFPCDVHKMAELKDAEIAEHVLRADSLRAELRRLEEELELDESDAVSEAVERIVEALEAAFYESDNQYYRLLQDRLGGAEREAGRGGGIRLAIALLRSRDWSKGDADG